MHTQGLPVLPHQKDALEKAGKALDAIRPHAATDLAKAIERRPELIAEDAGGRSQEALRAMNQETAVRTDPALRSKPFVSDWQGLSTARQQLQKHGDGPAAPRVTAKQHQSEKTLDVHPQKPTPRPGKPPPPTHHPQP